MNNKISFKKDKFKKSRGSYSRLIEIKCRKCKNFIALYQKDGSGNLRRMYLDRIFYPTKLSALSNERLNNISPLKCSKCKEILGTPYIYPKEKRKAFKLYQDAVIKNVKGLN